MTTKVCAKCRLLYFIGGLWNELLNLRRGEDEFINSSFEYRKYFAFQINSFNLFLTELSYKFDGVVDVLVTKMIQDVA